MNIINYNKTALGIFKALTAGCVSGYLTRLWQEKLLSVKNLGDELKWKTMLIYCLNNYYHSFHKDGKGIIAGYLNKILERKCFKNSVCLLRRMYQIDESILSNLDNESLVKEIGELKSEDEVIEKINSISGACFDIVWQLTDIKCNENCIDNYSGNDLFAIKKI